MIYTGCDLQVAVFLLLLLFWTKHHSTTETPPHNATISTTHDTPNAILHGPRYDPFRVGKGPRTRAYGPWRRTTYNGTRGFPPFSISRLFLPPIAFRARIPAQFPRARDGGGAIRAGGQGSCKGGASFWGNEFPGSEPKLTPQPPNGPGWREIERARPFREASGRSSKGGGAENRAGRRGGAPRY